MKSTKRKRSRVGWALVLGLGLALLPSAGWAEELTKFTGYTRPGNPNGPAGPLPGAARLVDEGTIGATVYFKVFELGSEESTDPWGTGFKNLDTAFVPGQASRGRAIEKLDTTARYLYVYQVINDSYRDAQVKSVAIRLLVPPHLITSWGHFAERDAAPVQGTGFAMEFDDPDPKKPNLKSMVLPMSTEHAGISDALYRNPAPYFNAPQPYQLSNILVRNKPVPLSVNGENTGREPERVVLQSMVNFEGAPNWLAKDRVKSPGPISLPFSSSSFANPYSNPFSPMGPPGSSVNLAATLRRAPAVVAYWTDDPLRPGVAGFQPGQRSVLFGFTSNFPPVYEDVRVRGNTVLPFRAPLAFVADARAANLLVDGQVPTPVAVEPCCVPAAPRPGSLGGPVGGIGSGGGLLRGGMGGGFGGGFPFFGGFGLGNGGTGGGGGGGMSGGGGGGMSGGGGGGGLGNGSGNGNGNANASNSFHLTTNQAQQLEGLILARLQAGVNSQSRKFPWNLRGRAAVQSEFQSGFDNQSDIIVVNVQQSQSQAQQQAQAQVQWQKQGQIQGQHQRGGHPHHHGHVVPEPAAVVSALLGVPVLLFLVRRRKILPVSAV